MPTPEDRAREPIDELDATVEANRLRRAILSQAFSGRLQGQLKHGA